MACCCWCWPTSEPCHAHPPTRLGVEVRSKTLCATTSAEHPLSLRKRANSPQQSPPTGTSVAIWLLSGSVGGLDWDAVAHGRAADQILELARRARVGEGLEQRHPSPFRPPATAAGGGDSALFCLAILRRCGQTGPPREEVLGHAINIAVRHVPQVGHHSGAACAEVRSRHANGLEGAVHREVAAAATDEQSHPTLAEWELLDRVAPDEALARTVAAVDKEVLR